MGCKRGWGDAKVSREEKINGGGGWGGHARGVGGCKRSLAGGKGGSIGNRGRRARRGGGQGAIGVPHPSSYVRECCPPFLVQGEVTLAYGEGGGGGTNSDEGTLCVL